ncbi:methylglyoxal synthase, partial [marine sediment metagenome]
MGKLTLALVAHDHKKPELLAWVKQHIDVLKQCNLVGTGTQAAWLPKKLGLEVTRYKSGPL